MNMRMSIEHTRTQILENKNKNTLHVTVIDKTFKKSICA